MKKNEKKLIKILKNTPNQEFEKLDYFGTGRFKF